MVLLPLSCRQMPQTKPSHDLEIHLHQWRSYKTRRFSTAIVTERSSQGGYREAHFNTPSAISLRMVVTLCEVYPGVVCLDTRKDVMWQVMNKKYSEQRTSWRGCELQKLNNVLISPSQNNLKLPSNKLTHLLAHHLQRDGGTQGS